ncbi:nucleoside hydrolase [bacterium]|nr:nucleoside hydrolase [bacterium]
MMKKSKHLLVMLSSFLLTIALVGVYRTMSRVEKTGIILDTDPGLGVVEEGQARDVDDGLVIVEALNNTSIEVLGIGVVQGNSRVENGMKSAQQILSKIDKEVPLWLGAADSVSVSNFETNQAVEEMAKILATRRVKILAIGPLSNVATLVQRYPKVIPNIEELVVVMGRSPGLEFFIEDKGPLRDFNFDMDVEAVQTVLDAKVPMTLAPFELSVNALIDGEHVKQLQKQGVVGEHIYEGSQAWMQAMERMFEGRQGFHPWDSAAFSYLSHPEFFKCEYRGFRISKARHSLQGNSLLEQNLKEPFWFELSNEFNSPYQLKFCFAFEDGALPLFLDSIVQAIHD